MFEDDIMGAGLDAAVVAKSVASELGADEELASCTVEELSELGPPATAVAELLTSFSAGLSAGDDELTSTMLPVSEDATGGREDPLGATVVVTADISAREFEFWESEL